MLARMSRADSQHPATLHGSKVVWTGDTPRLAAEREPACGQCGGPWRELGHCKGVCLTCGFMQSCVDTL
jgi:hypothetical protein